MLSSVLEKNYVGGYLASLSPSITYMYMYLGKIFMLNSLSMIDMVKIRQNKGE